MDSIRSRYTSLRCKTKRLSDLCSTKLGRLVIISIVTVMLTAILTGAAISKYAVIINDGNRQLVVYTSESDPHKILQQQKIALSIHDEIDFTGMNDKEGTITVNRAKQVNISADNKSRTVYIAKGDVGDALTLANITVDNDDLINVSLSEKINEDMDISISRVDYKEITTEAVIPSPVEQYPTQTLKNGKTRLITQGTSGLSKTVVKQTLIDGKIVEEAVISTEIVKKPTVTTMLVGDSSAPTSQLIPNEEIKLDKNGNPVSYVRKVTGKATAYSSLGRPTKLKPGHVAMNYAEFPRGTKLYIKTPNGSFTYGYSVVSDTGPAVRSGEILVDLFFGSYRESVLFGAKNVEIYVLE